MPFAAAIDAGVDAILTAHVVADAVDDAPVSLSAPLDRAPARSMGFDGVIITDALDMDAVAEGRGIAGVADAAVRALRAGADFLCLGSNFDDGDDDRGHRPRRRRDSTTAGSTARTSSAAATASRCFAPVTIVSAATFDPHGCATGGRAGNRRRRPAAGGPFAVLECRPPGSMACFNVTWGLADALGERGWPTASITESDPIEPTCDAVLEAAGDMPMLVVVRDACVHTWQTAGHRRAASTLGQTRSSSSNSVGPAPIAARRVVPTSSPTARRARAPRP